MTYFVYAFTNDRARIIVKKAEITWDAEAADVLAEVWEAQGYIVTSRQEE